MEKRLANNSFPFWVWILTVAVIGPISLSIMIVSSNSVSSMGFYANLLLYLVFGLIFSLPVFGIYYFVFKLLTNKNKSTKTVKVWMTLICLIGMYITFYIMSGEGINLIHTSPYPGGLIISTLLFKVYKEPISNKAVE